MTCWDGQCIDAAAAPNPKLIVSLTADDSYDDQFRVMAPILEAHGMRGTLYVSSGRIDVPGREFLTSDELHLMQTLGHEIGSHGLMHQHLVETRSLPDRIRREICDSRVDLLSRGYAVRSFSYPFGEDDGLAESLVSECGYTSGRGVGTIGSSSGLWSDSAPPGQPFMIRAASSVNQSFSLAQIQSLVENAEAKWPGPGIPWLVLNFHRFCPMATCNPGLAWDTGTFADFVAWLDARRVSGTFVRTISEVAQGPLKAGVASGTPLALNGAMESYLNGADAAPDCWLRGGSGVNVATWSRVPGRSGYGQQVTVREYKDGSKSLIQDKGSSTLPDYRSCSTPVTPGRTYTFQCWYKSDVPVSLTFYRNSSVDHVAVPWVMSPGSPPSPGSWAPKTYAVTIPAGFTSVSFGPYISNVCTGDCMNGSSTATLIVDDCSVTEEQ
jgi:peptidoglycan/xylan/chitin deacetylase (PgdA/CDA1 family)